MAIVLEITQNRFYASSGKLDSDLRYVFKQANGSFVFPIGRTLDLPSRGLVYNIAGISRVTGTSSSFSASYNRMTY